MSNIIEIPETGTRESREWKSCCITADKEMVRYICQLVFIALIMVLCVFKLVHDTSCTAQIAYSSMLTMLLGIMCPSPKIK